MKQVGAEKYNIAWFKLADCIARGEKERALGVYRLLSHSLDDKALACQLHGDILLSFNDDQAQEKYLQAAQLYQEDNRIVQAAAVYEHLVSMNPNAIEYKKVLVVLYQHLGIVSKVQEYGLNIIIYFIEMKDWHNAMASVDTYESYGEDEYKALLCSKLALPLMNVGHDMKDIYAQRAIDAWRQANNKQAMQEFLKAIKSLDKTMYDALTKH